MLQFLLAKLPAELVCEIALFEGRIVRAYLRDYICQVYARVYQKYFGYRYTLRVVCGEYLRDSMGSLPFYAAWSTMMRKTRPGILKTRKPRAHMRPYVGIIPGKRLIRERDKIEESLAHFFCPKTGHS